MYSKLYKKQYYLKNKEKISLKNKEYRRNNLLKVREYERVKNLKNKDRRKELRHISYLKNRDILLNKIKKWRENNKDTIKKYLETNKKQRYLSNKVYHSLNKIQINKRKLEYRKKNIQALLSHNLRSRLNAIIRNKQKTGSAIKDLGCTILELKIYLEKQFPEGMTWDNYNHKIWHIDHIKPLSKFNLTDRKKYLKAVNYTNLQPLWAFDNLSKGNK